MARRGRRALRSAHKATSASAYPGAGLKSSAPFFARQDARAAEGGGPYMLSSPLLTNLGNLGMITLDSRGIFLHT